MINEKNYLKYKDLKPSEIEKKSFEIIEKELNDNKVILDKENKDVIMRAIHTTADFDYVNNLIFSNNAVGSIKEALCQGAIIVTDTNMAKTGINKSVIERLGSEVVCFMSDEDIIHLSNETGKTRAYHSMKKAAKLNKDVIFAIGNAPTALISLYELVKEENFIPKGIIGVPVGFVNVVEAKELILELPCPYIVAKGRKGGSNLAAAICNAIIYNI